MVGLVPRPVTISTDTILYSDNNETVEYQGSVAVAVTLPTTATLGNANYFTILSNFTTGSSTAVTITPTTWTVNGSATLAIAQGQGCRLSIDPSSATNWLGVCGDGPLSAGTNITLTRTKAGVQVGETASSTSVNSQTCSLGGSCTITAAPNAAINLAASGAGGVTGVLPVANLPVLHGQCTEAWGGSGTSFAMTSGDDAIVNNTCYNDSGATRTITVVKCRSDQASNTTVLTPTFGSDGTGTAILTGTVTWKQLRLQFYRNDQHSGVDDRNGD
jgi:hypothetical protein